MRTLLFTTILLAIVFVTVTNGDKPKAKACVRQCKDDYTPVCGQEGTEKGKSFGNECVLSNYNCEHGSNLKVISKGECPGGGGVRLS